MSARTRALDGDAEPRPRKGSFEARALEGRPDDEPAAACQASPRGGQATGLVEPCVAGGRKGLGSVVHIEKDGIEGFARGREIVEQVGRHHSCASVLQRTPGELGQGTAIPCDDRLEQLDDDRIAAAREEVEDGAQRVAHPQAADEDAPRPGCGGRQLEPRHFLFGMVLPARHQRGAAQADLEIAAAGGELEHGAVGCGCPGQAFDLLHGGGLSFHPRPRPGATRLASRGAFAEDARPLAAREAGTMKGIQGKTALVTGAGSGIGRATAARLAHEGARVVGIDITAEGTAGWQEISSSAFAVGDVRDEAFIRATIADLRAAHGSLDIVVNAAGVAGGGAAHMVDTDEWDRVVDINLKGTFLVCKHALASMLETGGGALVNVASIEGLEGTEGGSAYNASKGGVVLFTKNVAIDYGRRGIRANCVCPGFIDTGLTRSIFGQGMEKYLDAFIDAHQLGRIGQPEEVAAAIVWLASDEASFVTGHAMAVDGGFTAGRRFGMAELMGLA